MGAGRRWDGILPRHLKGPAIGANSVVASARRMCQGSIEILGESNRKTGCVIGNDRSYAFGRAALKSGGCLPHRAHCCCCEVNRDAI
jgi:hypothetical protein